MVRLSVEQRRHAAIVSTLRVIATEGVEAATTRRIADEAKVGQSSLFYAFANRDELLAAVVEYGIGEQLAAMAGWLDRLSGTTTANSADSPPLADADVADLIRTALRSYVDDLIETPEREHALITLSLYAQRTPGLEHLSGQLYAGYFELATRVLEEAAVATGLKWATPIERLAPTVVALTDGITLCYLNTRDRDRIDDIVEGAVGLLCGLLRDH